MAFAAFVIENDDPGQAMLGIHQMPRADGVFIDKKGRGDLLAASAVVQQDESIGPANNPLLAPPVTGQNQRQDMGRWVVPRRAAGTGQLMVSQPTNAHRQQILAIKRQSAMRRQ
jgi:hypothetical protein